MREIYKNPMMYYLVAPILVGLWPLLVSLMYLPDAKREMQIDCDKCVDGQTYILDILRYDSGRLSFSEDKNAGGEFEYDSAISRVTNMCGIRSTSCLRNVGPIISTNEKKTRNARVELKAVGIIQAATFLSYMQSMWVGLKCDQIKLTKKKGMPDQWDVEMKFWYTY
jgi:hypothetical protein